MRTPCSRKGRFSSALFAAAGPALLAALLVALLLALAVSPQSVRAHGSVVDGGEGCIIQFDFYSAHFSIFQPQTRQHREYCEDLPDVTESVFVLEYRHNSLREVPVDFRIMHNTSELGRFVRWSDIEAMDDIDAQTVFFQRSPPQADGVLSILHTFTEPGSYVGIVSAPHPTLDQRYYAVFPFRVGLPWWQNRWLWLALAVLIVAGWRIRKRQPQPFRSPV
ncbi:MAG: hypothetical protein Q7W55_04885 [Pseudohongiella sp.]|nr:hypothetical protein [Pseudohongiella sp.]MDO9519012.1 hypothetical protein [Pseudohongiella sp.]